MTRHHLVVVSACLAIFAAAVTLSAQQGGGGRGGGPPAYPQRTVDAAAAERGKALYDVNCRFCHGADIRGGDSGPSLLRSQLVMNDQKGETISQVVKSGRPGTPMPAFKFTDDQIADIAEFLHGFTINSRDPARVRAPSIVVGNPQAGQAYFQATCSSCHSVTGNLAGIATKFADARALQQAWLMPGPVAGRGGGPAVGATSAVAITATVTPASGVKVEGQLERMDEFSVTLITANGRRTFQRQGDVPRIEINDPLARHKALLSSYTDKNIHDVTAYLVTIK
jgi:cytochrome c oxidase cbb3-type subunit III